MTVFYKFKRTKEPFTWIVGWRDGRYIKHLRWSKENLTDAEIMSKKVKDLFGGDVFIFVDGRSKDHPLGLKIKFDNDADEAEFILKISSSTYKIISSA